MSIKETIQAFNLDCDSIIRFVQQSSEKHADGSLDLNALAEALSITLPKPEDQAKYNLSWLQYWITSALQNIDATELNAIATEKADKLFQKHPYLLVKAEDVITTEGEIAVRVKRIYEANVGKLTHAQIVNLCSKQLKITTQNARYHATKAKKQLTEQA